MKTVLLHFIGCLFTLTTFSQGATYIESVQNCANVTKRIIDQEFSDEQRQKLEDSPEKLSKVNYVLSASYEYAPDQMIVSSQKMLFDIRQFEHLRKETTRVTVYDEVTGLSVILKSNFEIEKAFASIENLASIAQK